MMIKACSAVFFLQFSVAACMSPIPVTDPPSAPTIVSFEKLNHTSARFILGPGADNSSRAVLTSFQINCTAPARPNITAQMKVSIPTRSFACDDCCV